MNEEGLEERDTGKKKDTRIKNMSLGTERKGEVRAVGLGSNAFIATMVFDPPMSGSSYHTAAEFSKHWIVS